MARRSYEFGDNTMQRLKSNRAWQLAQLIGELLYDGRVAHVFYEKTRANPHEKPEPDPLGGARRFVTSAKLHPVGMSNAKQLAEEMGDGQDVDTMRMLREAAHELERIAVKECT